MRPTCTARPTTGARPDLHGAADHGGAAHQVAADRRVVAQAAFVRLGELWREWQSIASGGASNAAGFVLTTRGHQWVGGAQVGADELCDIYRATDHDRPAATASWLKIARRPEDGDLVANEAALLSTLAAAATRAGRPTSPGSSSFPRLIESVRHRDSGGGGERRINVIEALDGFCTLAEVAAAYPDGLDPRDPAWMWRRLLVALGAAHRAGVVHAAVVPDHVLIQPDLHGLVLAGWYYGVSGSG